MTISAAPARLQQHTPRNSPRARAMADLLRELMRRHDGPVAAPVATLAAELAVSPRTAQRALRELHDSGRLSIVHPGRRHMPCVYTLRDLP